MLRIEDIRYSVEGRPLFEGASATIPTGHKVGLVGRNGTGKTTLFRLIRGELALEGGAITPAPARPHRRRGAGGAGVRDPRCWTRCLPPIPNAPPDGRGRDGDRSPPHRRGPGAAGGYRRLVGRGPRLDAILKGLGFTEEEQLMPCSAFSGGWRMRVALAGVLFAQPDLLLSTNRRTTSTSKGRLWLESYLARYPHTVIVISHDRGLLNRAVGAILHLEDRKLTYYQGGYDTFARHPAEPARRGRPRRRSRRRGAPICKASSTASSAKASKAVQAQSRVKMLES
jgi:ATP-binding cassette, subfamily F, member 3